MAQQSVTHFITKLVTPGATARVQQTGLGLFVMFSTYLGSLAGMPTLEWFLFVVAMSKEARQVQLKDTYVALDGILDN